jgi:DASH complex subunit DAD3
MSTDDLDLRRSTTPTGEPSNSNPLLVPSNPLVSDLEQEVLDEYARLLDNVNKVLYMYTCTRPNVMSLIA